MGALWVLAALCVVGVIVAAFLFTVLGRLAAMDESMRQRQNYKVRQVYARAGARWYPYEMADGSVRWYRTTDDHAVDL